MRSLVLFQTEPSMHALVYVQKELTSMSPQNPQIPLSAHSNPTHTTSKHFDLVMDGQTSMYSIPGLPSIRLIYKGAFNSLLKLQFEL